MNLSQIFIKRFVMTTLIMVCLLFFGALSYINLPVNDLPNVDMPTIEVSVDYPGLNPETMANSVTTVLEQQFMTIEAVENIFSTSSNGSSNIVLQFSLDRDIDKASTDVQASISKALSNLPSNLPNSPTYSKVNPSSTPILYFAISSNNMTLASLYDFANTFIGERISMIEGVAQVIVYGSAYAVRVQVDPEKLAAKKIGLDEVALALQNTNVNLPVGSFWGKKNNFTIDVDGQISTTDGYNELIIKNKEHELVKLKDVGTAIDSVKNNKFFQHYIKKSKDDPCILLAVKRLAGMNTVEIVKNIESKLKLLQPELPASLKIEKIYDKSEAIQESVQEVKITIFIAFLLVIVVIYLFLGRFIHTLIPSLAIPFSLLATFTILYVFGYTLDILSLLAITLSIGFLVDDAIVVLENHARHLKMGKSSLDASIDSAKQISNTVICITLCLAAVFIPMLFMKGVLGKIFKEFAVTIIVAVLFSGFISLSIVPMILSKIKIDLNESKVEKFSYCLNETLKNFYEKVLRFSLKNKGLILGATSLCVIFSVGLFFILSKDFLPPDDIGYLQGYTLAQDGTSPSLMHQYHQEIAKIALENENIDSILSISSYTNSNEGMLFFKLKPFDKRTSMQTISNQLSTKLSELSYVNTYISYLPLIDLQLTTTATALYQYSLTSTNQDELFAFSEKLVSKMKSNPIFKDVSSDLRNRQPVCKFHILRDKAANFFVSAQDIENFFQLAFSDNKVSQINSQINQYDVILETLPQFYKDPTVLSKLFIRSSKQHLVPLEELVDVKQTIGPLTINHLNGLPVVNISFNPNEKIPLGTAVETLKNLANEDLPPNIFGKLIGTASVFKDSMQSLILLIFLAIFVIYVLLGVLYENFIHPITVMSTVIPTLFGGLLSLYLTNQSLTIYSFVGLILLMGIVLKNSILMIDFAIEKKSEGKNTYEAILDACLNRFRPILMTTICALMGAVPIALGLGGAMAQNRIALGICVVGGLIISQILTLILTPVLYIYLDGLQEKFSKLKK